MSSACIGLIAGKVHLNVTAGTSSTQQIEVFNSCANQSIYYNATARFAVITNMTTPNVTISPAGGMLGPSAPLFLNLTVYMPANAIPNTTWVGGAAIVELSGTSSASGASVQTGVIKRFTVTAFPAPVNYTEYALVGVAAVVIVAVGIAYRKFVRKVKKPARKAQAKRAATKRTPTRKRSTRRSTRRTTKRRRRRQA